MKQLALFLLALATVVTCSCGGGHYSKTNSSAQMRSIQTSGDSVFDVQIDGHSLFAKGSPVAYKPVSLGSHTLEVTAPGTSTALASLPASFAANTSQTLIVAGATEDQSLTSFMVMEDTTPPTAGQIKLRFVHGAHQIGPIDIYVMDAGGAMPTTPTFANVSYKTVTSILTRPAQDFTMCWGAAGATGGLSSGAACNVTETVKVNGKYAVNSTWVLSDPPVIANLPPGTFVLEVSLLHAYGN